MKIKKTHNNKFKINLQTGVVKYTMIAHNYAFTGIASCSDRDAFDEGKGMRIAHLRAEIDYRKFEAKLTQQFINNLKHGMQDSEKEFFAASKMYMTTIQSASENLKAQYKRIKILQNRLNEELK